jgi:hypothetical protein
MMTKKQKKFKGIKGMNKGGKLIQLTSCGSKFLEDDLMQDGVEGIHHIHLKHHLIKVDILNDSNIMDHCFAITLNCHLELMQ